MHGESTGCTNTGTCRRASSISTGFEGGGFAEIVPRHVGREHHSVEPQFVQGIAEFGECLFGAVAGKRGEGAEAVGVLGDQLGVFPR